MKYAKPLLASVVVILLAWGAIALINRPGTGNERGVRDNSPAETPPEDAPDNSGYEFITEPLEDLPALDPPELWPRQGYFVTAPVIDVSWRTTEHARCRLIASHDARNWHEVGHTVGERHILALELSQFGGEAYIAVEYDDRGRRYRSTPRRIRHTPGAWFPRDEYVLSTAGDGEAGAPITLRGRTANELRLEAFEFQWFTLVRPGVYLHGDDDAHTLRVTVANPDDVPPEGVTGFIELFDARAGEHGAYDRARLHIRR